MKGRTLIRLMKVAHSLIWAFFVLAICAIWTFAIQGNVLGAAWAVAIVLVEVAILGLNQGRCPLGGIVGQYTHDRAANFDIYLPTWLADRTKAIFGPLFGGGVILTAIRWATAS